MIKKSKFHDDECNSTRMNFSDLVGIHAMITNPIANFTT